MERDFQYDIMDLIKNRWSPRAFSQTPIDQETIMALIEAASYAPSCFNEQPWRFLVADTPEKLALMQSVIMPNNQAWANQAPVLILIAAERSFSHNQADNRWHAFDTGTAWGFLALEAQKRGLITHAMGGFDRKKAREVFAIPDHLTILTVVAVGQYGAKEQLTHELQRREKPNLRKKPEQFLL